MIELFVQGVGEPVLMAKGQKLHNKDFKGFSIGDILRVTGVGWSKCWEGANAPHVKIVKVNRFRGGVTQSMFPRFPNGSGKRKCSL